MEEGMKKSQPCDSWLSCALPLLRHVLHIIDSSPTTIPDVPLFLDVWPIWECEKLSYGLSKGL